MKLKLDEKGGVVVQDGKPVYVADDGKDIALDYPGTLATISRLNAEAKGHRERAEAAEAKLKPFEGIEDPAKAREAIETVRNLDSGKLLAAGEVEKIKAEIGKAFEDKFAPITKERDGLKAQLFAEKIGGSFSRSKFIADKLAIPADLVEAKFGKAFTIEDGKVVAKDASGNRIYSRERPGELADFDEAMETLVSQYPHRDHILKGAGGSGSGAGGAAPANGGRRTITRAQCDALDPAAKATAARELAIVD